MTKNPFDQYDEPASSSNPFDQYDEGGGAGSGGLASDLGKSLKAGVQRLPGMATGLLDLPFALATGTRPVTTTADYLGKATGFQPGKWADETNFSQGYQASKKSVDDAWKGFDGVSQDQSASKMDAVRKLVSDAPQIAGAYLQNPSYTMGQVAESVPSIVAGGAISKVALAAGRVAGVAANATTGAAARAAAPGALARTVGDKWAVPVAAGIGEGAITTGDAMAHAQGPDQQKNALAALGAGVGTALLGAGSGRVANALGLETAETALARAGARAANGAATTPPPALLRRVLGGMVSEAVLQELPQSAQEQMWQNFADGKSLWDGVARAGTEGALAGGVMGVAANIRGGQSVPPPVPAPQDLQARSNAEAAAADAQARADAAQPAWDTAPGAADPNADRATGMASPANAPLVGGAEFSTSPGAGDPNANGLDFDRDIDTGTLAIDDRPLSEKMGLNPAAGPLSASASVAVDSGAYMPPAGMPGADPAAAPEADPMVLQNRDRTSAASIAQMQEIAANPDYLRVGPSRDMTSGAPIVFGEMPPTAILGRAETVVDGKGERMGTQYAVVDAGDLIASNNADGTTVAEYATGQPGKLRSVAGNGRTAGLQAAYGKGTAGKYQQELAADAEALGIDGEALLGMKRPVLVRVMQESQVTNDMGDRTNITATQKLSPLEQAGNDARRLDVRTLAFDEGGNPTPDSIKGFVSAMPVAERGDMLNADGTPTRQAVDRLMAATFKQAFESDELVQLYAQATDPDARAVMAAAADASGVLANLKGAGEFDVRSAVADAAKMAVNAARQGLKLSDVLRNGDIDISPEAFPVAAFLAQNIRSPKQMAEGLRRWGQLALEQSRIAEENNVQGSLMGPTPTLTRAEIFARIGDGTNPAGQAIAPPAAARQAADPVQQPTPTTTEGTQDGPAPNQTQQAIAQPAQGAGAQAAAPAAVAAPAPRGENWRNNTIQAGRVARDLGLNPKGKKLQQMVQEIDAFDAQQNQASAQAGTAPAAIETVAEQGKNKAGRKLSAQSASQQEGAAQAQAKTERFEIGKSLTKEQRKQVLESLVDAYKAKGAEREFKGQDSSGNDRYGYAHSPDLFEKSDVTGAMVRYYVTLPDGRIAHPTELFPTYSQSDIDTELARQQAAEQRTADSVARNTAEPLQFGTRDLAEQYWDKKSAESASMSASGKRTVYGPLERTLLEKQRKFVMVPDENYAKNAKAYQDSGWVRGSYTEPAQGAADEAKQAAAPAQQAPVATEAVAPEAQAAPALDLTAPTKAELLAKQEAQEAAAKQKAKDDAKIDAAQKAARDKKDVDARMDASADNFVLGQDADDAVSGQDAMFSRAPAKDQTQTAAFKEWFADSAVVDAQGQPLRVYHGTNADFTVFDLGRQGAANGLMFSQGFYFSEDPVYANMMARDKEGANVMPAYVSLQRPKIFQSYQDARKFPAGGWSRLPADGAHDGVIIMDEGAMVEVVAFQPEQVKSATGNSGAFDSGSADIRFSRTQAAEVRNLVTLHNLSEDSLLYADQLGGIPAPSIGITKVDSPFGGFGGITLIAPKGMIDPAAGVPVYDRDAWTARFPEMNFKSVSDKKANDFYERMKPAKELGGDGDGFESILWERIKNDSTQSPDKVMGLFRQYQAPRVLYAREVLGKEVKVPMRDVPLSGPMAQDKQLLAYWKANKATLVSMSDGMSTEDFRATPEHKQLSEQVEAALERAWPNEDRPGKREALRKMFREILFDKDDGLMSVSAFRDLGRDADKAGKKEIDRMKLGAAVDKLVKADDPAYLQWAQGLVAPLFDAPTITLRGREVAPTLDNLTQAMTVGSTEGAEKSMAFGAGKTAAMLGKRFKSLKEIQAARDQVVSQAQEQDGKKATDVVLDAYREAVLPFFTVKDWRGQIDTWEGNNAAMEALARAGKTGDSPVAIRASLAKMGFKSVDADSLRLAKQAIDALRNAATDYFEAKPQRAVKLNEFQGAVVPKGTSAEAMAVLEKAGIVVEEHGKAEGAREKAIQKLAKRLDKERKDVLFSQARATATTTPTAKSNERLVATQMLVDGLKEKWTRAPEIIVARNMQDQLVPQRVREYDAKLKSQGATGDVRGFIYGGQVFLLSDKLGNPKEIAETLYHEVLGHYGLRGAFGSALAPVLNQMATMRKADIAAKAREYGLFDKAALGGMTKAQASDAQILAAMSKEQKMEAAEEVLAEMAQATPRNGFVQRAISAIRNWLRANVPGFKGLALTDADIIEAFIVPARGFVTRSKKTGEQSMERALGAFSRGAGGMFDWAQREAAPVGAWVRADYKLDSGTPVHQVRDIPVSDLYLPELTEDGKLQPEKRRYLDGYAERARAGEKPPAITVIEMESGRLRVSDGHRRVMAARAAGVPTVRALVSPLMETADGRREATEELVRAQPAFSRAPTAIESSMGALDPAQEAAYKNVAGVKKVPTLKERADIFKANLGLRMKQALVDQFAPIKDVSQQAYMLARMSKGTDGAVDALLMYGKPFLRDGVLDVNTADGGFAQVMAGLKGEHDRFFMWVAAQRAERLKAEGKENLMGDSDISALKTLNAGTMADGTVRVPLYAKALQELNAFNEASLKVALQSGLIDQAAYGLMKDQPYVPFYRLMEDEAAMSGPRFSSGLLNQKAWKKLKGGTQQLNADLMQNALQNWSHLYAASARNRAALATMDAAEALGVAYKVPSITKGASKVMRDGKTEHWMVEDPYLLEAISALNYSASPLMKPLAKMKQILTFGVTVNPTFKIRNLIRDSLSSISQSELGYNPLKNVGQGWALTAKDSQVYASMVASGGVIRFGSQENTSRLRDQVARLGGVVLDEGGLKKFTGQLKSLYDAYADFGDRTENVNRAALYDQLIKKGHNHAEASFMARDLMDFSMGGSHPAVRFLTQSVPFLNARLQGLYKLGRAAGENPRKFATVAGAVSLASLALLGAYSDDEDWKKREDWDRDAYWWFKVGGTAYRIPKPFELGAIGTLAERTAETMFDEEMTGKRFMQRIGHMAGQTFALDPVPQAFKPLLDIYANKDSFTGRAIESQADQRLRPKDRYNERTSELARLLGGMGLPEPSQLIKGDYSPLSPKQVDHLIRGYFSWLGTATTTVSDFALRPAMDRGERPDLRLRDVFLAGNFVESLPTGSSRYVSQMYEQSRSVEQAFASYREALKQGDTEKAASIKEQSGDKLRNRVAYATATKQMSEINAQVKRVEANRLMPGEAKRERLNELDAMRGKIAARVAGLT